MGLINGPLCRRCGAEEETSAHILCECEVLVSLRRTYLGSIFLDPKDIKSLSLGAVGGVEQRKKPQLTFCVIVRSWLYSNVHIWAQFSWTKRILRVWVRGPSGTLAKWHGSHDLVSDYGTQRAFFKAQVYRDHRGSNPTINLNISLRKVWILKEISECECCDVRCSHWFVADNSSPWRRNQYVASKREAPIIQRRVSVSLRKEDDNCTIAKDKNLIVIKLTLNWVKYIAWKLQYTGWFIKRDSVSYIYISWTIHGMWMIYIKFERGDPVFSNTTARALA